MDKIYTDKWSDKIIKDRYILFLDKEGNRKFCTINEKILEISDFKIDLTFFLNKEVQTFWEIVPLEGDSTNSHTYKQITNKEFYSDYNQSMNLIKNIELDDGIVEDGVEVPEEKVVKRTRNYQFWIAPTTLTNCVETLVADSSKQINYLSMNTLSTILNFTNLTPKCHILIYDETHGFLCNAITQRTSMQSNIICVFDEKVRGKNNCLLNLRKKDKYPISYVNRSYLVDPTSLYYHVFSRYYNDYFENMIICIRDEKELFEIFFSLFRYLKICGIIIIYSKELDVMIKIERELFDKNLAIDIKINETKTKERQEFSYKSDKKINNKGNQGYVLTAVKVNNFEV